MSRCFPFPPPGYEKKPRTDDTNLLNKEKRKEKRHKKDKRDKEKNEDKEKREKDRSNGKHREKKDRKEKNRGEKKDKEDRDKGRDKSSISEEKRVGGQEGYNGEKIHPREELDKEKICRSDEKTVRRYQGEQGEKLVPKSNVLQETEDAKYMQELGRRIRNDKGAGSSQPAERFNIMDHRMDDAVDRYSVRDIGILSEVKNKEKKFYTRKMDDQRIRGDAIIGGIAKATTVEGMASNRFEGTLPLEKKTDKKIEEREKYRDKEGVDKRGDKRKNKDTEKQSQGKDKDRAKEKKKEEKAKEKSERKKTEQDKIKLGNKIDNFGGPSHFYSAPNHISPQPSNSVETGINEGNLKKRKETETNGFSHDHETRPNKMARLAAHPISENEKKLEAFQSPSILASNIQEASSIKLNAAHKEHKRNGIIANSPVLVSKPKIPSSSSSSNYIAQSFPVPMTKPSSSTVMPVSTAKLPSASATENAAAMISISAAKPSSPTANEVAALVMPLVELKPSTTSSSVIAAQSISKRKPSSCRANENEVQVAPVSTKKPSSATHNAKVSMRPPHPDSKHLNQILRVPKMEWSDFEDQEWLFGSKDAPLKKPGVPSLRVHEELQVWAEALKIESADIYALPYVVPY